MFIKTISVTYERKLNMGNYSSAKLGLTLWADLDFSENEDEAIGQLQEAAREHVRSEYIRLAKSQPQSEGDQS